MKFYATVRLSDEILCYCTCTLDRSNEIAVRSKPKYSVAKNVIMESADDSEYLSRLALEWMTVVMPHQFG